MYSVPEGYFQDLKQRLEDIPHASARVTTWMKVRPYVALAASFAIAVTLGRAILRATVPATMEISAEEIVTATNPYAVYDILADNAAAAPDEEDLINYLIDTGANISYYETDY
ncbi:MAG: hypothetical protein IJ795_00795 [Bacteroidales bacterium]|nr:hypothetical protein [Bacteroidales bacterium]